MEETKVQIWNNAPLPERFREKAYFSANEFALYREDAMEYLRWCKQQEYHVLGCDGWIPTLPGPTPILSEIYEGDADFCIASLLIPNTGLSTEAVFNIWVEENVMG